MSKEPKKKEGTARLMELAGTKKAGLTAACTLSVLSSVFKIVPYFTIYSILKTLIRRTGFQCSS
jgi:ATP-binding cassette subfamily B protein